MIKSLSCFMMLTLIFSGVRAEENNLDRDEVKSIKTKLQSAIKALGESPAYIKEQEDFNLPTEVYPFEGKKFHPVTAGVSLRYEDRVAREGKASMDKANADFQSKYQEAAAKGDYETAANLSAEFQNNMMKAATEQAKQPLQSMHVNIQFNSTASETIDPDLVVLESPGILALKQKTSESATSGSIYVYISPKQLKDTKKLSKVELLTPKEGAKKKLDVFIVSLTFNGPLKEAQEWVQKINTKALLALVDGE